MLIIQIKANFATHTKLKINGYIMRKNILSCALLLLIILSPAYAAAKELIIGGDDETSQYGPFDTRFGGNKIQIILTQGELQRAGAEAGNVHSIAFHTQGNDVSAQLKRFRVRLSEISQEYFYDNEFENPTHISLGDDSPESIYTLQPNANTWININLTNPFYWSGNSNLLIEIAWTNGNNGENNQPHNLYAHRIGDERKVRYLYKRELSVPDLSSFSRPIMTTLRPKIKLSIAPAQAQMEIVETQFAMGYLDEYSISNYRKVEFSARNLTPQEGEIICIPSSGLLVSTDLEEWKEYPQTLSILYSNGKTEDKKVYCKLKSGSRAEEYHADMRIQTPGVADKIVHFSAKGGSIFQYYCESAANKTEGGDISNISFFFEDGLIFSNGQSEPIYDRADCNNKYSNFTNMKKIHLRENTGYSIKVSLAHAGSTAKSGKISVYLDYDRNAEFDVDELIWTEEKTREGSDLEYNTYWGNFTMPSRARLGGDNTCLLRVVYDEDYLCDACGRYNTGETEDYAVQLLDESYPLKTALKGEYTIGGNAENEKHYNNLQNLAKDIDKYGLAGDVTLAINTNLKIPEGKSIELNNPSNHKITIYPRDKTRTISGSANGKAMLYLRGNIYINGKINSETKRNALKFKNLGEGGTAISISSESDNTINIGNTHIESDKGISIRGNGSSTINVNNCKFITYACGINIDGGEMRDINISDNLFSKGGGISISGGENAKIANNEFDLSTADGNVSNYAISLIDKNNKISISSNKIYNFGEATIAGGISINGSQNRDIHLISNAINCNNASSGIYLSGSEINLYHNTVNINGDESSSAVKIAGGEGIALINNLFINKGLGASLALDNSSSLSLSKNNNYYAAEENRTISESGKNMSLSQWQGASGKDIASTEESVSFLEKMKAECVLSLESALSEKLLAPSIAEVREDIHGRERSAITQKGVDEAIPKYEISDLPDKLNLCVPDTLKLKIKANLLKFNDDIKRGESKKYPHKYRYYWRENGVIVDSTSDTYYAQIKDEHRDKPIEYCVEVATHGQSKKSNLCEVYSERKIEIIKEPKELYELSEMNPEAIIDFEAVGTISGYQWQKLIKNKWVDLSGESSSSLIVSADKHGAGIYHALLFDGEYKCNKGNYATRRAKVSLASKVKECKMLICDGDKVQINSEIDGYAKIEIIDLLGRVRSTIYREMTAGIGEYITMIDCESGIYYVKVTINNTIKLAKIIKKY